MLKQILVAVDGSGYATRAVTVAAHLAALFDARLVLLNVLPETGLPPDVAQYAEAEGLYSEEIVLRLLEQAAADANRAGATDTVSRAESGDPAAVITKVAGEEGADLIVMGRRGLGPLREMLLGSVSHKVGQLAPCACLVVS